MTPEEVLDAFTPADLAKAAIRMMRVMRADLGLWEPAFHEAYRMLRDDDNQSAWEELSARLWDRCGDGRSRPLLWPGTVAVVGGGLLAAEGRSLSDVVPGRLPDPPEPPSVERGTRDTAP